MRVVNDKIVLNKKEKKIILDIKKTEKLLGHFGLCPYACNPGVESFVIGNRCWTVDFDGPTWKFVEPLLRELLKYRNKYGANEGKRKKSS